MSGNADQVEFWNGPAGHHWAEQQEDMDRNLSRIHASVLAFAAAKPGEKIVDIGCGSGTTTLALADAAGSTGTVMGVDISRPMLSLARERAKKAGKQIAFIEADASSHTFVTENDLVFSRFGVMFFDNPGGAFANVRSALRLDGRLAFVCWRTPQENVWASAPVMAARPFLPPQPPPDPTAPGPFAFADGFRTKAILESAGFRNVRLVKLDSAMNLGSSLDAAATQMMSVGPLARLVADADEATRAKILPAVREALAPYVTADGVTPPAACWLVGAIV